MLLVKEIHSQNYGARPMGRDNYHIYDYSLFHMNLRKNARRASRSIWRSIRPTADAPDLVGRACSRDGLSQDRFAPVQADREPHQQRAQQQRSPGARSARAAAGWRRRASGSSRAGAD